VIVNVNVDENHGEMIADHDHVHDHEEEVAKLGSGEFELRTALCEQASRGNITDEEARTKPTMTTRTKTKKREFNVIIERDSDGYYVATVPELRGCHTQAKSLDALIVRVREAIDVCLDAEGDDQGLSEFIGVQRIAV
jgi:predicted RNase H-like HicB family nuclease